MPDPATVVLSVVFSGVATSTILWLTRIRISERNGTPIQRNFEATREAQKFQSKYEIDDSIKPLNPPSDPLEANGAFDYSRTFDRKADAITSLNLKLQALNQSMLVCITADVKEERTRTELDTAFRIAALDFWKYYVPRRICIPETLRKRLERCYHLIYFTPAKYVQLSIVPPESPSFDKLASDFETRLHETETALKSFTIDSQRIRELHEG